MSELMRLSMILFFCFPWISPRSRTYKYNYNDLLFFLQLKVVNFADDNLHFPILYQRFFAILQLTVKICLSGSEVNQKVALIEL